MADREVPSDQGGARAELTGGAAPVRIRRYTGRDRPACRRLWVELTERHRRLYGSREIGGDDPGRQFDEHVGRYGPEHIWLATAGGEVVGMAGMIIRGREAELEPIVVTERWRRSGLGRRLAERVIAEASSIGAELILTRPVARNEAAIHFFYELGFDALGQIELLLDLRPAAEQRWQWWQPRTTVAGRAFRV